MKISMIVAVADNNAIGINNTLPWPHIKEDMLWFKANTSGKVVVMGSSTWGSLPFKPLPKRTNVVLTSGNAIQGADLTLKGEPQQVIDYLRSAYADLDEIVFMGGAKVYKDFFQFMDRIYLSRIHGSFPGDTFLDVDTLMSIHNTETAKFQLASNQQYIGDITVDFEIWDKQ